MFLAAVLVGAGCAPDPGPTQPITNGAIAVESFVGTLAVGGSAFYAFTAPQSGTVTATLLTLTVAGAPSDLSVTIGFGVPSGIACRTTATAPATASINPQVSNPVLPGVYCISIADSGTLTAPTNFAVNITRPR